mgnify:CR=1 FL=1
MKSLRPINVGLLGIGTVGGGTFEVLTRNQEEITRRAGRGIVIRTVADKDLKRARKLVGKAARVTDDAFKVVSDPDIDIVIELIGGTRIARYAGKGMGMKIAMGFPLKAEEAYRLGIAQWLVPHAELKAKTQDIAEHIAGLDRKSVV